MTKVCTKCNRRLPLSAFCKQAARRDGLACGCKKCLAAHVSANCKLYSIQKKKLNGRYWLKNRDAINGRRREKRAEINK